MKPSTRTVDPHHQPHLRRSLGAWSVRRWDFFADARLLLMTNHHHHHPDQRRFHSSLLFSSWVDVASCPATYLMEFKKDFHRERERERGQRQRQGQGQGQRRRRSEEQLEIGNIKEKKETRDSQDGNRNCNCTQRIWAVYFYLFNFQVIEVLLAIAL